MHLLNLHLSLCSTRCLHETQSYLDVLELLLDLGQDALARGSREEGVCVAAVDTKEADGRLDGLGLRLGQQGGGSAQRARLLREQCEKVEDHVQLRCRVFSDQTLIKRERYFTNVSVV